MVLAIGLLCLIVSLIDFFMAFGASAGPPRLFFLGFIGLPMLFVGIGMTAVGYQRDIARYHASELAPVGAETINYMGSAAAPGITAAGGAFRDGLASGAQSLACPACAQPNDHDARFCDACGASIALRCRQCDHPNDHDARFCDQCGAALQA